MSLLLGLPCPQVISGKGVREEVSHTVDVRCLVWLGQHYPIVDTKLGHDLTTSSTRRSKLVRNVPTREAKEVSCVRVITSVSYLR